jgi:hypothetical protein
MFSLEVRQRNLQHDRAAVATVGGRYPGCAHLLAVERWSEVEPPSLSLSSWTTSGNRSSHTVPWDVLAQFAASWAGTFSRMAGD